MTDELNAITSTLVSMMNIDWLQRGISWLDHQGGFTQAVVSGLVLASGGLLAGAAKQAFLLLRAHRARATARLTEQSLALEADFASATAELGEVDHGVNTTATLETIQDLLRETIPPLGRVFQCLLKDTPGALPAQSAVDYAMRKRAVLQNAARSIHPDVLAIEAVASRIGSQSQAFVAAYRALFQKPSISDADRVVLRQLRETYAGGVADTFRTLSDLIRQRQKDIARFDGKQQQLSSMIRRLVKALRTIEQSVRLVANFCFGEMATMIERLLVQ